MLYRYAKEEDVNQVYDLICSLEKQSFPKERFKKIYQKQLKSENYIHLICENHGKVAGFLTLRLEEQLHHCDQIAEVLEFVVDQTCRNQGIGRQMFMQACQIAKENGCVQIELACDQKRSDAHRFYLEKGMHNTHYKFSMLL